MFGLNIPVGARVGAFLSADGDKVEFLGYGVYEGEHIPPGGEPLPTVEELMAHKSKSADPKARAPSDEELRARLEKALAPGGILYALHTNPRIRLDDGSVVWGRECWWGPEAEIRKRLEGREVVNVRIVRDAGGFPARIEPC